LYLGILVLYALLGLAFHGFRIEPGRLVASCLLAGNWYLVMHPTLTSPMRALWSISVEEQWYVAWPIAFICFSRSRLMLLCVAMVTLSLGVLGWLGVLGSTHLDVTAWDNSFVQVQFFALGAFTALMLQGVTPSVSWGMRGIMGLGGLTCFVLAAGPCAIKSTEEIHKPLSLIAGYLLAGIGASLVFFCMLGAGAESWPKSFVYLGKISFGLYVFHETGFFLANACFRALRVERVVGWSLVTLCCEKTLAFALAVILASLSYRYWELPFLRLKKRWTRVPSRDTGV
jgi:peptidoglycan/LPS O-acetylase OafA/YrhL